MVEGRQYFQGRHWLIINTIIIEGLLKLRSKRFKVARVRRAVQGIRWGGDGLLDVGKVARSVGVDFIGEVAKFEEMIFKGFEFFKAEQL
jgi:hypothetical protein